MNDFDNTNRGSIWKNDDKKTDNHPDFTGTLNVEGVEYWVSAWRRQDGASPKAPALSFSIKPKEIQKRKPPMGNAPAKPGRSLSDDLEDSIPF